MTLSYNFVLALLDELVQVKPALVQRRQVELLALLQLEDRRSDGH